MHHDLVVIVTTLALYLALTVSPGPNFALVSRLAISGSQKAAFGASIGIASASLIYAILSMTGLAVLLKEVSWVARAIQILGGCYLIYLGLSAWLTTRKTAASATPVVARDLWYGLRSGFLVDLSNPKGIAFFIGLYAAVIPVETSLWAKAIIVVGGYLIEAAWYSAVGLLLSLPPARVVYGRFAKWIERALGALMVAFGLRILAAQSE
jgi:threonine/homoserine/homoserine lactone efflux protein